MAIVETYVVSYWIELPNMCAEPEHINQLPCFHVHAYHNKQAADIAYTAIAEADRFVPGTVAGLCYHVSRYDTEKLCTVS